VTAYLDEIYDDVDELDHHGSGGPRMEVAHAAAVLVIGALVFLIAIRRGFRGVGVGLPGVGSVKIG
jgi:hypothetical protein